MAVFFGLVLTPVGALIGSFFLFLVPTLLSPTPGSHLTSSEMLGFAFYGTIVGSILGAPVGVVLLPASYVVLKRRGHVSLTRLTVAGAVWGFVSVVVIATAFFGYASAIADRSGSLVTLALAADGAVTGAICGHLFARLMRRVHPQAWPAASPAKP